jgi:MiaB-like tRNA modifying enzyme
MEKIYFQTHGCTTNFSESEGMMGLLKQAGFDIVNSIEDASIVVLNVCTVKGENTAVKEIRLFKENNPHKKLVIAGCITKELIKELREFDEEASLISTHNIDKIVSVVEEIIHGNTIEAISFNSDKGLIMPRVRKNKIVGIVPISTGCNNECAYCSVKLVKGKLKSFPKEDILKEVNLALKEGCKELWITSQDNASYMTGDLWRGSLPELLNEIIAFEGDFKIRIGMMNPTNLRAIMDDLIEVYKSDKVFKFLHIPLQSGNDEILKKMRRDYTVEDFKEIVDRFRAEIPNLTISTDLIVGFPTETDEQFEDSLNALREMKFEVLNISRFVPRPRTEANYMKGRINGKIIKERSKLLTDIFHNIARMNNERWIDWEGKVLVDEAGKEGSWIARNYAYKQVILKGNYKIGQSVNVKIRNVTPFDLRADEMLE